MKKRNIINKKINLIVKRIYVAAFNIYACYWIINQVFFVQATNFENYLLWFFTTAGMHFFVLDNQEVYFKINGKK